MQESINTCSTTLFLPANGDSLLPDHETPIQARASLLVPANFYFIVLRVAQQDADRIALIVLPNRLWLDMERLQLTQSGGNTIHMEHDMNPALLQIERIDGRSCRDNRRYGSCRR